MVVLLVAAVAALLLGIGIGSVYVAPGDILAITANHLFGTALPNSLPASYPAMVLNMRLPRVILAFLTGAALAFLGLLLGGSKPPKWEAHKEDGRKLAAKKKRLYGEYQKARRDMQEVLTIKANIDCLLGYSEPAKKKEMER